MLDTIHVDEQTLPLARRLCDENSSSFSIGLRKIKVSKENNKQNNKKADLFKLNLCVGSDKITDQLLVRFETFWTSFGTKKSKKVWTVLFLEIIISSFLHFRILKS